MFYLLAIAGFLFVFSLLVLVHEFGHFIAAKKSGVKVTDFAFGFKPRIWSKKIGETLYSINLIPLGGYVNLYGMEEKKKGKRSYDQKPAKNKLVILLAGVVMNFVLAYFIITGSYLFGMKPILPYMAKHEGINNDLVVKITEVEKGTPAESEGLKQGDIIKKVEGEDVILHQQIIKAVEKEVSNNKNPKVSLTVLSDGRLQEKEVSTYKDTVSQGDKQIEINRIGIVLETTGQISASFFTAFRVAFLDVVEISRLTFIAVYDLFSTLVTKLQITEQVGGPVAIFMVTGGAVQLGFSYLIQVAAFLSIAVAVFNLLPIPGLDGGHALIVIFESITKRKFPTKTKNLIQLIGFGALILLLLAITFKDLNMFGIINFR